jgi:hypothetical protein
MRFIKSQQSFIEAICHYGFAEIILILCEWTITRVVMVAVFQGH